MVLGRLNGELRTADTLHNLATLLCLSLLPLIGRVAFLDLLKTQLEYLSCKRGG